MTISVLIPTYRRSQDLSRCLDALAKQEYPPHEVLVVVRDSDQETQEFLERFNRTLLPVHQVLVSVPGQVAALNAGLSEAQGAIIAITDDDCIPRPDWLKRMAAHFITDARVGGVGGRDWQPEQHNNRQVVGKVQWFGRIIGNHHLGNGEPREVDVLKGANMGYRRDSIKRIRFDARLLGSGAQVHNDMGFSLAVRHAGWKLIYDPAVATEHFPAQRLDGDLNHRGIFNASGLQDSAYNETLILLTYLPPVRRCAFLVWAFLVGTRAEPGAAQALRLLAQRDKHIWNRLSATYAGRLDALSTMVRQNRRGSS